MKKSLLDSYEVIDARDILSICPDKQFVDTTITSPPYWNLKDYGSEKQVGYGQSYEQYLNDLEGIFSGIYKITKRTGSLWIVADTLKCDGELKLLPFDLAQRLKKVGWILQDVIVWHKDKTLPWSHRGKLRNIFEYILFFSKGPRYKYYLSRVRESSDIKEWWMRYPERYSPQGSAPTRTWKIPIPRQGSWGDTWVRHFCPFPPELVRRIILLTTQKGDVIADPFAGSGVVLAQAKASKRYYLGTDLRSSYRQMFRRRVLPSIKTLEATRQSGHLSDERKRKRFSALIWKLRKTKFPRELLRTYEKKYGRTEIVGTLALAQGSRSLRILYFFAPRAIPPKHFLAHATELVDQAPLSKYGLRIEVAVARLEIDGNPRFRKGFSPTNTFSLYKKGRTYSASGQITGKAFLDLLKVNAGQKRDKLPPIASNVRVKASREMTLQKWKVARHG